MSGFRLHTRNRGVCLHRGVSSIHDHIERISSVVTVSFPWVILDETPRETRTAASPTP